MDEIRVDPVAVKDLFEDLMVVAEATDLQAADPSFDRLLSAAKRAAAGNPEARHLLIQAIARFEAVSQPVPRDPELLK